MQGRPDHIPYSTTLSLYKYLSALRLVGGVFVLSAIVSLTDFKIILVAPLEFFPASKSAAAVMQTILKWFVCFSYT